jgi:hypothetical protein
MNKRILLLPIVLLVSAAISFAEIRLDSKSTINPAQTSHTFSAADFTTNSLTGDTLITWYESDSNGKTALYARLSSKSKVGMAFKIISSTQSAADGFADYKVAFNPDRNEYLVAHSEGHGEINRDEFKILVQRLKANGHPQGKQIDITSSTERIAPFDNEPLVLRFNPNTGGYSLFFGMHGDFTIQGDSFGFYALLNADGTLNGDIQMLEEGNGGNNLPFVRYVANFKDFAFLPNTERILISGWGIISNTPTLDSIDYVSLAVDPTDPKTFKNLKSTQFAKIAKVPNIDPSKSRGEAFRFVGSNLVFLTPDKPMIFYSDNQSVKARKLNLNSGKPLGGSFTGFNAPANKVRLLFPTAAFSLTSNGAKGVLIGVEDPDLDGSSSVWAQELDTTGKPIGAPTKFYTSSSTERIGNGTIIALPVQPGETSARFVWYGMLQKNTSFRPGNPNIGYGDSIFKFNLSLVP